MRPVALVASCSRATCGRISQRARFRLSVLAGSGLTESTHLSSSRISAEVNRSLDLQETLERALDRVSSWMGIEAGVILLLNEARGEFMLKAQRGMGSRLAQELVTMKAGRDFPAVTPELERAIVVKEIAEYPRLGRFLRDREGFHS